MHDPIPAKHLHTHTHWHLGCDSDYLRGCFVVGVGMSEQVFTLTSAAVLQNCMVMCRNLPVDGSMEIAIRKVKKLRTNQQNHLMWGARLKEISEQAWINGRQFSADVWHEHLKREFLPEGTEPDFDKLVIKGYQKWAWMPNGERDCIGSTTKLTTLGMSRYMTMCEAYAATELGVRFSADRVAA